MAIRIAIHTLDTDGERIADVTLPANKNTVIDAMDRAKIFGEASLRITECDETPELARCEFTEEPTLDELNFLAKRLEEISEEKTQIIAYQALLKRGFGSINEAINRTYNLETIPVYPCKNVYSYGEIVLENEFLEELRDIPDEIYKLLDPDKVGSAMVEREGGVFIDGYYAIADSYEPALVYDEELPEPQEDWIFKLEIAGIPESAEDFHKMKTEILTLPADEDYMQDIAEALGERHIDECSIMKFESAIPQIDDSAIKSAEDIYMLNEIAWKFSKLSREDAVKFKAVLQNANWESLKSAENILEALGYVNLSLTHVDCLVEIASRNPIAVLETVSPEDLKNTPCILVASRDQQKAEQEYYQNVFGFKGDFLFANSIEEARLMVVQNNGFMPVDAGMQSIGNATVGIPLCRNDSPITRHYCAFWKKDNSGYYIESFAEMLEAAFSEPNN